MATQQVFLHIGLHKSGTTYLQQLMRMNRSALAAQGLHVPGGRGEPNRTFAVYDLFGRRPRGSGDDRITGQWDAMTRALMDTEAPRALLSEEALSLASVAQARKAVRSFPDCDVRVVVTVRDLARVALSAWQEDVKTDETWTWRTYADALADPGARATSPARGFWLRQDVPAVLDVWAAVLPADRIHVVTVPPPGAEAAELTRRFSRVVEFDAAGLDTEVDWGNTSMGAAGTEVLRRANEHLHRRLNQRQYHDVVETTLAPLLAEAAGSERLRLPEVDAGWVSREADRMVASVREAAYPVVGDLGDLVPRPDSGGREPGKATEPELLEVAVLALAGLTERFALAKWQRRRPDAGVEAPLGTRAASSARSLAFRAKRVGINAADSNPVAERGLGVFLRTRAAWRARRRAKTRR
ncbi:MAG: hypothetical protein M3Q17_02125 [Actinomycetota bacterium]|nr:hypothetical protein [Actinomycetota bacterium]